MPRSKQKRSATKGKQALRELNTVVKMAECSFVDAAKGIGVDPNDVYRWRNAGQIPDRFLAAATEWAQKTRPKTPKVEIKPKTTRGSWKRTTPGRIKAFRVRHSLSGERLAALLSVSASSLSNWMTGAAVATRANQARIASTIRRYDADAETKLEQRRPRGGLKTRRHPKAPKVNSEPSKRDRLAKTLMEFAKEDGESLADSILYAADILRSLQTVGKLPE